jgi:hypothetical protein
MGDVKIHHRPNYLILFNYFKVCGGDEGIRMDEAAIVLKLTTRVSTY